ncbi:lipopolysaccharide-induced tumor necrosis factor-alpha factor homolog isoform X1 [Anolis sagrei]|uniref:lipopolysaccharide-induced tumor necrosis factor-alpha factor homolog isoform X1 n=2 Tax=Anolis sagrei TaxID=38937 RepID=UPI00351FBD52
MAGKMTAPPPPFGPSAPPPSYEETVGGNNSAHGPPKGGMPPPYPQQLGTPIYVANQLVFQDRPVQMTCPSCRQLIITRIEHKAGTLSWISCGTLFLLGCWVGCCLVPFCVDAFLDVDHFCPNCQALLGCYKRL